MSARLPDWPEQLAAFLAQRRRMPFAWGVHDCCQFARRAVEAITGRDPAAHLELGFYATERGAARVLARLGGITELPGQCGLRAVPLSFVRRGDVVLLGGSQPALGICIGGRVAFPASFGLAVLDLRACFRAWRV